MSERKTSREYWDDIWVAGSGHSINDPSDPSLGNRPIRVLDEYFRERLASAPKGARLLEIGCANSTWLPYFAHRFGLQVTGLDYSEVGCEAARSNLKENAVVADVVCADLFTPPEELKGRFDFVVSFGVVEHFEDTVQCLQAMATYLQPQGVMITNIPNMTGAVGWVQKAVNRPVFDIHVPLDRDDLARAHEEAGLVVRDCRYLMSTNFGVCNLNGVERGGPKWWVKKLFQAGLARFSILTWWMEDRGVHVPVARPLSPYVYCTAQLEERGADSS